MSGMYRTRTPSPAMPSCSLDWRGSAPLPTINDDDLREFLLGWCPRKLSIPAEDSREVCEAVGEFVFFLGSTGRMKGGPDRARSMQQTAVGLIGPMMLRMADPANFGMAKSLFAGISGTETMSQEELTAALQQRMDEHNALPLDQRRAATDRFFEPTPMIETIELPFLYVAPRRPMWKPRPPARSCRRRCRHCATISAIPARC